MSTAVRGGRAARLRLKEESWSPRRGRTISVTLRGGVLLAVAIILLSVAYIAAWPELLILASFCAIPPLLALLLVVVRHPRLMIARSSSPGIVGVAGTGSARIRLHSASRVRAGSLRWSDDLPWASGRTSWNELPPMSAGAGVTVHYDFVPPRRGIVELGPFMVEVVDPFGLARGEFPVGGTHRIIVAPEAVDLDEGVMDLATRSGSARLFLHSALAGDHDIMTRDYRSGDALSRVHWKASAHHGELMVREDEKRSHAEAIIVVDTRRANWRDASRSVSPDRAESECFEWALSMTLSLRDYLVRKGLRVSIVETAVNQLADAGNADDFVESLARVRLSYQNGPSVSVAGPGNARAGSLCAVLDAPDAEVVGALVAQSLQFAVADVFLLGGANGELDERFARAGWNVHRVAQGEGVREAWQSAVAAVIDA